MDILTFFVLGGVLAIIRVVLRPPIVSKIVDPSHVSFLHKTSDLFAIVLNSVRPIKLFHASTWLYGRGIDDIRKNKIKEIKALAEQHEVAEVLGELIHKDGAGSWPPNANHAHSTWPEAIRPFKEIYLELASLLPQEKPSLHDQVNAARIASFRNQFRYMLSERVDMAKVMQVSNYNHDQAR